MDEEEVHALVARELPLDLEVELLVVEALLLVAGNLNFTTSSDGPFAALQVFNQSLVASCDNFVERELE